MMCRGGLDLLCDEFRSGEKSKARRNEKFQVFHETQLKPLWLAQAIECFAWRRHGISEGDGTVGRCNDSGEQLPIH